MDHFNQPHAPMPGGTGNLSIAAYGVISPPHKLEQGASSIAPNLNIGDGFERFHAATSSTNWSDLHIIAKAIIIVVPVGLFAFMLAL